MVWRPDGLTNGNDTCIDDDDDICGDRHGQWRLYEYGNGNSNSESDTEYRLIGFFEQCMFRRRRYTDGQRSGQLQLEPERQRNGIEHQPDLTGDVYSNWNDKWLQQNGKPVDLGNGDAVNTGHHTEQ